MPSERLCYCVKLGSNLIGKLGTISFPLQRKSGNNEHPLLFSAKTNQQYIYTEISVEMMRFSLAIYFYWYFLICNTTLKLYLLKERFLTCFSAYGYHHVLKLLTRKRFFKIFSHTPRRFSDIRQEVIRNKKQTPWPLVRKRTIPIERPPLFGEM
jgi:hypothetical protein